MVAEPRNDGVEIHFVTPEEGREIVDQAARHFLKMSGEEFIKRWEGGDLDVDDEGVWEVAILLPFAR